jgi:ribonucleoside-diphosphate reductase alpha chain
MQNLSLEQSSSTHTIQHATDLTIVKRDGVTTQNWSIIKVRRAIEAACGDVGRTLNGSMATVLQDVEHKALARAQQFQNDRLTVDEIQGLVKQALMSNDQPEVAEAYIVYASQRDAIRSQRSKPDPKLMSEFIHLTRYAKFVPELGRRELPAESIDRVRQMYLDKYPQHETLIREAFAPVYDKVVLPSMRSMQFGGAAVEKHHAKNYNCAFSVCNRIEFFREAFYLLLCGTGTGFSVQWQHVDCLPALGFVDTDQVVHHVIADSIEGWADAFHTLIVEFAYHQIRPKGTPLKTSGGRAPGHIPLFRALTRARAILDTAQGRQLKPIECYDLMCMAADAVYAGGIREAAMICLFSIDDGEMMNAKTGNWFSKYPWRTRSNNSVAFLRANAAKTQYMRVFKATRQFGEPAFIFLDDLDYGFNPCVEAALNPKLIITPDVKRQIERWAKDTGHRVPKLVIGTTLWGWQNCNLSSVNCAACDTPDAFYAAVKSAATIGTLQASYTDFPYLGWISEFIVWRESLLGVSITGMMDNPKLAFDPVILRTGAQLVIDTNANVAELLGINSAARTTVIKPEGTGSKHLGGVASGVGAHHARRYFSRIRCNPADPAYQYFKQHNPHMCTVINNEKELVTFPVCAGDGAITRHDLSAVEFLEKVLVVQQNWVIPGTAKPSSSPGCVHNVSNTISVAEDEWGDVAEFIWKNRKFFSGVSLLPDDGDKRYENAPREEVTTEADEAKYQMLVTKFKPVDWSMFHEDYDTTNALGEASCAGGACLL